MSRATRLMAAPKISAKTMSGSISPSRARVAESRGLRGIRLTSAWLTVGVSATLFCTELMAADWLCNCSGLISMPVPGWNTFTSVMPITTDSELMIPAYSRVLEATLPRPWRLPSS